MLYHCTPGSFSPAFFCLFFFLFVLNLIRNGASGGLKAIDLTENERNWAPKSLYMYKQKLVEF